jgi:hypothetical protein
VLLVGNVLGVGRDAKVGKNLGHGQRFDLTNASTASDWVTASAKLR